MNHVCGGNLSVQVPSRQVEQSLDSIKIIPNSWQRDSACGRHRWHQQDVNGQSELLEAMRHRFADECDCDGSAFNRVSLQHFDAHFIVQPDDAAVGYVVFRQVPNLFSHKESPAVEDVRFSRNLLMLSEVYVEPRYRKKGMAFAALGVLLAGRLSVAISEAVVDTPARALCVRLLFQLGFKEQGRALFTRGLATFKTEQDENAI